MISPRHGLYDVNERACHLAARVVGLGAVAWLAFTILTSVALDIFMVDLIPILLLSLASAMGRGSVSAATWSTMILILYSATGISIMLGICITPGQVRVGPIGLDGTYRWVTMSVLVALCIWSGMGAWLSWRGRRAARRMRRHVSGHCMQCGYDLAGNVSGRCPECGADVCVARDKLCGSGHASGLP